MKSAKFHIYLQAVAITLLINAPLNLLCYLTLSPKFGNLAFQLSYGAFNIVSYSYLWARVGRKYMRNEIEKERERWLSSLDPR